MTTCSDHVGVYGNGIYQADECRSLTYDDSLVQVDANGKITYINIV